MTILKFTRIKFTVIVTLVIFAFLLTGCSLFSARKTVEDGIMSSVESGEVVRKTELQQGGSLLIVPFSAGSDVAASKELDQVSLMIVKGIAEDLQNKTSAFKILSAENANTATMFLKGRIIELESPQGIRDWVTLDRKKRIAVQGKLETKEGERDILLFSHFRESTDRKDDFAALGYMIGQDIAQFISTSLE